MPTDILDLRDYQQEIINAIESSWDRGLQRPAAVAATGLGKTVCFAHLIKRFLLANPRKRVLVLAHTDELVTQAAQKIKIVAPQLPVGIVKAARNDVGAACVVGSVQTLRNEKRRNQITDVGLIIVDECHHATAKTYRDILEHLGALEPASGVRAVGFTATMARSDGAALGSVWQEVVITRDILFGIQKGYLLDVSGVAVEVPDLDLDSVKKSRGDFQDGDLGRAMTESLAPELVAKAYVEHASNRSGLMFWPTVEAAYVGADAMNTAGIVTEVIHGGLKDEDTYDDRGNRIAGRRSILRRFMASETQVISNCMVLTEGFDAPLASCVVIARPTRSKPLYQQIVGRVLRPHPGQTKALILDVCGASQTNDLCCLNDLTDKDITVKEGQTLIEAVEEAEAAAGEIVVQYHGPVVFADFDPLKRKSRRVWMQTKGGTHFLAWGGKRCLFLVPSTVPGALPGTWDVAWCTKQGAWTMPDGTQRFGGFVEEHRGIDLGYAMKWAEGLASDVGDDGDFGRKGAPWRRRPASEKQLNLARRWGCEVPAGATGGEVSEMIDVAIATQRVDYYVNKIFGKAA